MKKLFTIFLLCGLYWNAYSQCSANNSGTGCAFGTANSITPPTPTTSWQNCVTTGPGMSSALTVLAHTYYDFQVSSQGFDCSLMNFNGTCGSAASQLGWGSGTSTTITIGSDRTTAIPCGSWGSATSTTLQYEYSTPTVSLTSGTGVGGAVTVCAGYVSPAYANTITKVDASGTSPYTWTSVLTGTATATFSSTTSATPTVTFGGSGTAVLTLTVSNNGKASAAASTSTITVVAQPVIATNPTSQNACVGSTVTLTSSATNSVSGGTFSYQWYYNSTTNSNSGGTAISGASGTGLASGSNASYTLVTNNSATTSPGGTGVTGGPYYYYCVFTPSSGTGCNAATSTQAGITVVAQPVIATNPTAQTACLGSTVTLTSSATNSVSGGTFSYQWYYNSTTNSNGGGTAITGASGTGLASGSNASYALVTNNVATTSPGGTGVAGGPFYYYCVFTPSSGTGCTAATSTAAGITVVAQPVIATNPTTQTACQTSTVTLTSSATNSVSGGTFSYQWYYNGTTNSTSGGTAITGASGTGLASGSNASYSLVTNNASTAAPGGTGVAGGPFYYYCVFTPSSGTGCNPATSTAAGITVVAQPVIATNPTTQTACLNAAVSLTSAATNSVSGGTFSYQWYYNGTTNSTSGGTAITGASGTGLASGANATYSLVTSNVATTSPGGTGVAGGPFYYYCIFTPSSGTGCTTATSTAAGITVVAQPVIATNPTTQTACQTSTVTLTSSATNSVSGGTFSYQWYYNGTTNSTSGGTAITGASGTGLASGSNASYNLVTNNVATTSPGGTGVTGGPFYYYCVFTPSSGTGCTTATSTAAGITVVAQPVIASNPTTQTACKGSTVTLSSAATNSVSGGTFSYQWYYNGTTNSSSGGTVITGASGTGLASGSSVGYTLVTNNVATTSPGGTGVTGGPYYYYCVFTPSSGTGCTTATSTAAGVTVVAQPVIATNPTTQTACLASTVTLTSSATNSVSGGTFSYQWYYNGITNSTSGGTAITGASGTGLASGANANYTLVTNNVATTSPGGTGVAGGPFYYYCIFTPSSGTGCTTATSTAAGVTVVAQPVIATNPTTQTACLNAAVSLTSSATNSVSGGTFSYQWYYNGTTNSTSGGTSISGASGTGLASGANATYNLVTNNSVTTSPGGTGVAGGPYYYYCVFTPSSGTGCTTATTTTAGITVVAQPVIASNPTSQTACLASTVTLTSSATNSVSGGTFSYQWYYNSTTNSNSGGTVITGASGTGLASGSNASYTLVTNNVATTSPGGTGVAGGPFYYYCVFTPTSGTGCNTASSTAAGITVVAQPVVATNPATQTACHASTVTLTSSATNSVSGGTFSYQWYYNGTTNSTSGGTAITGASGTGLASGSNASYTLVTNNVATTSPGGTGVAGGPFYYYCIFTPSSGTGCTTATSTAAGVTVVAQPVIATNPSTQTACKNSAVALTSSATNSVSGGTFSYQWYYNGTTNSTSGGTAITGASGTGLASGAITTYNLVTSNSAITSPGGTGVTGGPYYYYCVFTPSSGTGCTTATSTAAGITVVAQPVIATSPTTQATCLNSSLSLTASAINSVSGGTFSYQWYYNGTTNSNSGGTAISGASGTGLASGATTTYNLVTTNTTTASPGGTGVTGGPYYYYCVFTPSSGTGCSTATTTAGGITVYPVFTYSSMAVTATMALNQTLCSNNAPYGTFGVTGATGGSGSFTYKWYSYNGITTAPTGTTIPGTWTAVTSGTNYTQTTSGTPAGFSPLGTTTSITYACYVTPSGTPACVGTGQWASGQAQMTVQASTAFESGGNASVCTGATVNLNATTPITGTITWQWYASSNIADLETYPISSGFAISGATSTSYSVTSGNQYYVAVATYPGSTCSPAYATPEFVTVNAQPAFVTSSTVSPSVCTSGVGVLGVTVTGGSSALTYQWSYAGSNVVNNTPTNITYGTSTSASLTATVGSGASAGTYTYTVSVTDGGASCVSPGSTTASLTVNVQPTLSNLTAVNICTGGTATFTTTSSGGIANPTGFTWQYYNGSSWNNVVNGTPANVTYSVSTSGATSTLTVNTTSSVATGSGFPYQCVATYGGAGCTSPVTTNIGTLTVYAQPSINSQPGTTLLCQGGSGSLTVGITGGTGATYQWKYNNGIGYSPVADNTSPLTGITYSGTGTSNPLTINASSSSFTGSELFKLYITYPSGSGCNTSLTSNAGTALIATQPTIVTQPASTSNICNGSSASLTIGTSGGIFLTNEWQYNNGGTWADVANGTPAGVTYSGTSPLVVTTTSGTTTPGSYQYRCIVNSSGSNCNPATSSTATVVVNALPVSFTPTVSVNPVCPGASPTIDIANSQTGVTYQLQNSSAVNITGSSSVSGTGSSTPINLSTASSITTPATYQYQVKATTTTGSCVYTSSPVTAVIAVSPDLALGTLITGNHYTLASIPTGWTNPANTNSSPNTWTTSTTNEASSGNYQYYNGSSILTNATVGGYVKTPTLAANNNTVNLVTNNINTTGYSNISVLWAARKSTTYTGTVTLWYNIGAGWNSVSFTDVQNNVTNDPWNLVNGGVPVKLPASTGGITNLQLMWTASGATDTSYYSINDVSIYGLGTLTNCGSTTVTLPCLNPAGSCTSIYSVGTSTVSGVGSAWPSFSNVSNASLTTPLNITVPSSTAAGTYDLDFTPKDASGNTAGAIHFPVTTEPSITLSAKLDNCSCNQGGNFGNIVSVYAAGGLGSFYFRSAQVVDSLTSSLDASGNVYGSTTHTAGIKGIYWSKADGGTHTYTVTDGQCTATTNVITQSGMPTTIPFANSTGIPAGLGTFGGGNNITGSFNDANPGDAFRTRVNGPALTCIHTSDFGNKWLTYQVNASTLTSGGVPPSGDTTNNTAVVEINSYGVNLDSVSVSVYRDSTLPAVHNAATQTTACAGYVGYGMERHFMLKSTKSSTTTPFKNASNVTTPVGVRLYFTDAEFQDLKYWTMQVAASATGLSAGCAYLDTLTNLNSLYVTKYSGPLEDGNYTNNSQSGIYRLFGKNTTIQGNGTNTVDGGGSTIATNINGSTRMHYVELNVSEFSEFWLNGSQSIEALPVSMIYLEADAMNNDSIQVRWATETEVNNLEFVVERSADGNNWSVIGSVAGHGNSITEQTYAFNDVNVVPNVRYYYRLKQVDNNGNYQYTDVVQAMITGSGSFMVMNFVPNPTAGSTQLTVVTSKSQQISIDFYDIIGQKVYSATEDLITGNNRLDFDLRKFAAGTYSAVVTSENQLYTKKIVITR